MRSWAEEQAARERIERALERHRQHEDALGALEQEYSGRRTIAAQLVTDVVTLSRAALVEAETAAADHLAGVDIAHQTQVDRLEQLLAQSRENTTRLNRTLDEKRALTESREKAGEEVSVTIGRALGGWQLSDLEEVAYRLRCGGAVDETPVEVRSHSASAKIPAPNMVSLERPRTALPALTSARPDPSPNPAVVDRSWRPNAAVLALVALVALVVDVLARVLL